MKYLAFRVLFTALIKTELHGVFTVKLEINSFYTKNKTFSSNIDDTVGSKIFINFWISGAISPNM